MKASRRGFIGLLVGAAVSPALDRVPLIAPVRQAVKRLSPEAYARLWSERLFAEYVRESAFAPYLARGGKHYGIVRGMREP